MIVLSACVIILCSIFKDASGLIVEKGIDSKYMQVQQGNSENLTHVKTMFKGSTITFKISCDCSDNSDKCQFKTKITLKVGSCQSPNGTTFTEGPEKTISPMLNCASHIVVNSTDVSKLKIKTTTPTTAKTTTTTTANTTTATMASARGKRAVMSPSKTTQKVKTQKSPSKTTQKVKTQKSPSKTTQKVKTQKSPSKTTQKVKTQKSPSKTTQKVKTQKPQRNGAVGWNNLPKTEFTGIYILTITVLNPGNKDIKVNVTIMSEHGGSYLSVINWPMLPFFGFMSMLYLACAIGWLIASCCYWKDLLRVQFWIGGIIAIGMLENALFYGEYQNISHTGTENGLFYVAELVSCAKRALSRILVVIVSIGFGIVKPRLGQTLHKVLAAGILYFILASIEGCTRVKQGTMQMFALVPVTLLDVCLCWWVFTSLLQTTRTLRIRKNVVKLSLYHHFTNTLIFTVVASLAYLVWSVKELKFTECLNLSYIWLQEALWPFLFAIILIVMMILWRPSNNNQRYAFTPLGMDDSDFEDTEMTLSDAFEGMKKRNKTESRGSKDRNKADDDLKWVEENIPSVPSTLLPTIDSDDEIVTTKFEISKME